MRCVRWLRPWRVKHEKCGENGATLRHKQPHFLMGNGMSETLPQRCPKCGKTLTGATVQGLCAHCLGAFQFTADTVLSGEPGITPAEPLPLAEVAGYFPQLEILEYLGRGGMGVVYKARQKSLNRTVALKLLAPERVHDERFAARFSREARALAALSHPGIVTVYDFGQTGGFY